MTGVQPKRSYAQQGKYIRYGLLTGHSRIINAKCPLQFSRMHPPDPIRCPFMQREQPISNPTSDFSSIVGCPKREHNPTATGLFFHNVI